MNSNITITIAAPELVAAINNLAQALAGGAPAQPAASAAVPAQVQPQQPIAPVTPPAAPAAPAQQQAPTTPPEYTLDQLTLAASPLIDAGKRAELTQLLGQFGVQALTQLPKERYGEFATALRQIGAKV
jgi:hypothetical protein